MPIRRFLVGRHSVPAILVLLACAGASAGQNPRPTDDFGHEFVKIGRPHNRAALPSERYYNQRFPNLGAVGYRYRVSKTEVTHSQWLDFVNAYWPYWEAAGGARGDDAFTSRWITYQNPTPGENPVYFIHSNGEQLAVQVSWEIAARYANWLHNSKVNEEWAFETGAYDTSTFAAHPDGGYTHQPERSPGARFWLPSVDEWVKASHYDPNRYGEGQEGYWTQKGGQQTPLTPGLPENGGQTSAGEFLPGFQEERIPVGSYPHAPGPWGVLDASGGVVEWTETVTGFYDDHEANTAKHYLLGSQAGDFLYTEYDYIDWYINTGLPFQTLGGIRLASRVPPAFSSAALGAIILLAGRRRR